MLSRNGQSLFLLLLLGATSGCAPDSARERAARTAPLEGTPRARRQQFERAGIALDFELRKIAELTQVENGPGLAVCEPVVAPGSRALTDFGRGCARWLQFETAGQGAASKSPLWWSVALAQTRLEDEQLAPTAKHGVEAMRRLGATHVAIGELEGTPARATLTYQLYAGRDGSPVGRPHVLAGSLNEILKGLPTAVAQFSQDAGLSASATTPAILEAVPDLEFLGSLDRNGGSPYAPIDGPRLTVLAERSALASLYRVMSCAKSTAREKTEACCAQLAQQAPDNAAAWGVIAMAIRNGDVATAQPQLFGLLDQALQTNPQNMQLCLSRAQLHMARKEWKNARGWVQQAVRCNTLDPGPYQVLASCLQGENQSLVTEATKRGGLTTPESEKIWTTNTRRLELVRHAATLDPGNAQIWEAVSFTAMLQRNRELAEEALRKAVEHGKYYGSPYWWGIDLYKPAHLNDPAARVRFAETVVASAPLKQPEDRIYTAQLLYHRGLKGANGRLPMRVLRTDDERKQVKDWIAGKPVPWGGYVRAPTPRNTAATTLSASNQ